MGDNRAACLSIRLYASIPLIVVSDAGIPYDCGTAGLGMNRPSCQAAGRIVVLAVGRRSGSERSDLVGGCEPRFRRVAGGVHDL